MYLNSRNAKLLLTVSRTGLVGLWIYLDETNFSDFHTSPYFSRKALFTIKLSKLQIFIHILCKSAYFLPILGIGNNFFYRLTGEKSILIVKYLQTILTHKWTVVVTNLKGKHFVLNNPKTLRNNVQMTNSENKANSENKGDNWCIFYTFDTPT